MDKSTTLELLNFVLESIRLIHRRFEPIGSGDDFLENDDGLDIKRFLLKKYDELLKSCPHND